MCIHQSIAKQSLFRNPTDLRQFLVTAHGFTNARAGKMLLRVIGHKKYYGRSQYLLYEVYVSLVYPNRVLSYHEFTATSIPKKTFLLHLDKKITPEPFHS